MITTLNEAHSKGEELAEAIRGLVQAFHDETGLAPAITINQYDMSTMGETPPRFRCWVSVSADIMTMAY